MRLTKIDIQSVKSINKMTITLGKKTQIAGPNGKGKTAVIQAIRFLMEGSTDLSLINKDEDMAIVVGHFKGKQPVTVTRTLKRGKNGKAIQNTKVEISGMVAQRPQEYLNKFLGVGTFDPREVLDPKKRNGFIMELIDVRITENDMREALGSLDVSLPLVDFDHNALDVVKHAEDFYFHNRTERNREAKQAKSRYEEAESELVEWDDLPKKKMAKSDQVIQSEIDDLRVQFSGLSQRKSEWSVQEDQMLRQEDDVKSCIDELDRAERAIEAARTTLDGARLELKSERAALSKLKKALGKEPDIAKEATTIQTKADKLKTEQSVRTGLANHTAQETNVRRIKEAWETAQKKADDLDFAVDIMRTKMKAQIMKKADIPIKGLTYEDGEFLVDGKSIDALSSAEQLMVGLTLVQRRNKDTNMICIDAGECMDEKTYAALEKRIMDDGFHYVVTKVGKPFKSKIDQIVEMH